MGRDNSETGKKGNSLGGWLVLLLASPALLFVGRGVEPATASQSAQPSTERAPAARSEGDDASDRCAERFVSPLHALAAEPSEPLSDSFGPPPPEPKWKERIRVELDHVRGALGAEGQLDAFVATVADPIDSGLGYQFDTSLKALRAGFEEDVRGDGRFNRDRSFLPWHDGEVEGDARRASEECRSKLPGIVLFRGGSHAQPRLRALLLVGETPTSGVHREAFLRALEIASLFRGANQHPHEELGIVGPTFSGSAYSMRLALDEWARNPERPRVKIVTGTATGTGLRALLEGRDGAVSPSPWPGTIAFESTTPSEADLQCRYLNFVQRRRFGIAETEMDGKKVLNGVAVLHEVGTAFGTTLQSGAEPAKGAKSVATNAEQLRCALVERRNGEQDARTFELSAGVDLSFPVHISRLRDAYEDMDRNGSNVSRPEPVGRRTSLEISLRETRTPLDGEIEPSPKTTYAEDIAVTHLLGVISRSSVGHVAIQATDIGDAIFLARKIRDVAPDVRIAFLTANVLLLHPSFQRDLRGSLVVSAYPFLGTSDFSRQSGPLDPRRHVGFESSGSEGTYNAALAVRGATYGELSDYTFTDPSYELPIWISVIGDGKLVPILVRPSHTDVYRGPGAPKKLAPSGPGAESAFQRARLELAWGVRLPRFWWFVLASLALGFVLDQVHQRRAARSISNLELEPKASTKGDALDFAVIRTKWKLYAAIRSFVFAMALAHMASVTCPMATLHARLAGRQSGDDWLYRVIVVMAVGFIATIIGVAVVRALSFARDYAALGYAVGRYSPATFVLSLLRRIFRRNQPARGPMNRSESATKLGRWDRLALHFGLAGAENVSASQLSFCQLRTLANVALGASLVFVGVEAAVFVDEALGSASGYTLNVLRSLTLVGGVSSSTPKLLCLGLVYVWAFGRMARLEVSHGLSHITPVGLESTVSTPIRFILYPHHVSDDSEDESFGHIERRAVNSIVRPITGTGYCGAVVVLSLLPITLFSLKPLTTLERPLLTVLLMGGLGICTFLIINTLVQLVQYWLALKQLLRRVLEHRLGRSFDRVARFVRDSLEDQISRSPHQVLRLGACASRFDELVRWAAQIDAEGNGRFARGERRALERKRAEIDDYRARALASDAVAKKEAVEDAAELGRRVIEGAREFTELLIRAWDGQLGQFSPSVAPVPVGPSSLRPQPPVAGSRVSTNDGRVSDQPPPTLPRPPVVEPTMESPMLGAPSLPPPIVSPRQGSVATALAAPSIAPTRLPPPAGAVITPAPQSGTRHAEPEVTEHEWAPDTMDDALRAEGWRYSASQLAWLREGEGFVATVVALLLSRHVRQFHNFVQTLTLSSLLLMLAVLSYPFEPHRLLLTFVMCVVVGIVVVGFWIYIELDRSTLLSHIAGSVPGKLTLDAALIQRVFAWGVVPLLVIAAAQYPDVANALLRLADPFLRALR